MSETRVLTLADLALPRPSAAWKQALLVAGGAALTAVAAQVTIPLPWTPVPLTGQTFAVLLCGAALGARRGFASQLAYLAAGAAGLPVLAAGGGPQSFVGPTAGYLLAFPLAAAITGALAERRWDRNFLGTAAAMLLGSTVIFAGGCAWLARFVGPSHVLQAGFLPFVPGDVLKASLAALALPAAWRVSGRR